MAYAYICLTGVPEGRVPGQYPHRSGGPPALSQSDRADRGGLEEYPSSASLMKPLPANPTNPGPSKQQV